MNSVKDWTLYRPELAAAWKARNLPRVRMIELRIQSQALVAESHILLVRSKKKLKGRA